MLRRLDGAHYSRCNFFTEFNIIVEVQRSVRTSINL